METLLQTLLLVTAVTMAGGMTSQIISGRCSLPPEAGPCRGAFQRYYYDPRSELCRTFTYGGCGGNGNSFDSEAECARNCGIRQSDAEDTCSLPAARGAWCKPTYSIRYYYSASSGQCSHFMYGGCDGNSNNFRSKKACALYCDKCSQPAAVGRCRAYVGRFYYNMTTARCQHFIYGGCGGNQNNFRSISECQQQCSTDNLIPEVAAKEKLPIKDSN